MLRRAGVQRKTCAPSRADRGNGRPGTRGLLASEPGAWPSSCSAFMGMDRIPPRHRIGSRRTHPVTDLEKAALDAVRSAAERLGVDPFRLARFLGNGKIAEFLSALGRYEAMAVEKDQMAHLTQEYLNFLEEE